MRRVTTTATGACRASACRNAAASRLLAPAHAGVPSLLSGLVTARASSICVPAMLATICDPPQAATALPSNSAFQSGSQLLPHRQTASPLWLLSGARRWKSRGGHRKGGARAQPERKGIKMKRNPVKYKLKSHKGALKRFFQRSDGTFVHKAAGKKHLMAGASRRRQSSRLMAYREVLSKGIARRLRRLMPYGTTLQPPPRHRRTIMWEKPADWREQVEAEVAKAMKSAASGGTARAKRA
uniref:50S ribosomal protein L35 n=1 Tax=Haptolina brevifila TaxID=156173 RepID=A0A7S2DR38_9EUKA